jgi:hypothetical protein
MPPRGRRGRRHKQEQEQPPAEVVTHPAPTGSEPEQHTESDHEPLAPPEAEMQSGTGPGDAPIADGELALTSLPEGLLDEPLI